MSNSFCIPSVRWLAHHCIIVGVKWENSALKDKKSSSFRSPKHNNGVRGFSSYLSSAVDQEHEYFKISNQTIFLGCKCCKMIYDCSSKRLVVFDLDNSWLQRKVKHIKVMFFNILLELVLLTLFSKSVLTTGTKFQLKFGSNFNWRSNAIYLKADGLNAAVLWNTRTELGTGIWDLDWDCIFNVTQLSWSTTGKWHSE